VLSVVIPTKDHQTDLRRLLQSLAAQTVHPAEVIVVDGGVSPVDGIAAEPWPFHVRYEHISPPGLARQQNAGVRRVDQASSLVAFIDDDIVLEGDAVERMLAFWRDAPPMQGAAAFNLANNTDLPRYVWLKSLFGMDAAARGTLLPSGYQTKIGAVEDTTEVEWLYGGATVWRREVLHKLQFDEWFAGPGHLYELDFCFRATLQQYRLAVVADARVREIPGSRSWSDMPLGRWQVLNRIRFVRKYRGQRGLSVSRCWLALIGQFAVNVARSIIDRDRRYLQRAYGNCVGFVDALRGVPR
jgi:glycosyltransferase involved in cell wall biosynthesis